MKNKIFDIYTSEKDGTYITKYIGEETEVIIPEQIDGIKVTGIGGYAFYGCKSLISITIPNSVKIIGECAFSECTGLTNIIIGNNVKNIENSAFSCCEKLTNIVIPKNVKSIGRHAFSGCINLTSVTIENGLKTIKAYAFKGCSGLINITIPDSVTKIENFAFAECNSLTNITIPSSVNDIGFNSIPDIDGLTVEFDGEQAEFKQFIKIFKNLKKVKFVSKGKVCLTKSQKPPVVRKENKERKDAQKTITKYDVFSVKQLKTNEIEIKKLVDKKAKDIVIPSEINGLPVTSIGEKAFFECSKLESIIMQGSVTNIGDYAFCGCKKLSNIEISNGLVSIGKLAFAMCKGIKNIDIPNCIKNIGACAFLGCTNLTKITFPEKIDSIGINAFLNCGISVEDLPKGYSDYYENDSLSLDDLLNKWDNLRRNKFFIEFEEDDVLYEGTIENPYFVCYGPVSKEDYSEEDYVVKSKLRELIVKPNCKCVYVEGNMKGLEYVKLSDSVEIIDGFDSCIDLQTVVLGKGIKKIGLETNSAFSSSSDFGYGWECRIEYPGTKKEFEEVDIECVDSCTCHNINCVDGIFEMWKL